MVTAGKTWLHCLTTLLLGTMPMVCLAVTEETDTAQTMKDYYLSTVTVTATRTPKTLDNTPVVTRVVTAEDIRKADATNIRDVLLAELPGVEFTYAMNQQLTMSMQGLGGMAVLILVDGERLAGETLDNTDYLRLNMADVERIEIVKGAASALYGSNAVGAVVNIITKSSCNPLDVGMNTRWGSRYGEQRHGGKLGIHKGKVTSLLNVQYDKQNPYHVFNLGDTAGFPVYGNRQWNVKEKLMLHTPSGGQLTARGGYYFHERRSFDDRQRDRARDFSGGLRYTRTVGEEGAFELSYTADRYDKSDYYPLTDKDYLDYKNVQHGVRGLLRLGLADSLTLTMGGDAMSDFLMTYQFAEGGTHSQLTADAFVQADWLPHPQWDIVAGVRTDWLSHYGSVLTPKLAVLFRTGCWRLRAGYAQGFRAPTLKEMYMDFNMANIFNIYGGGEALKAEKSHSYTLSGEYVKNNFSLTVTGLYNAISDEITTLWDRSLDGGRGAMRYTNIPGTRLVSVEVTGAARFDTGFSGKVSYAFFREFPLPGAVNTADTRPHALTAQVDYKCSWKPGQLTVVLNGRYLSEARFYTLAGSDYESFEPMTSPSYTLWKLLIMQTFGKRATMTLGVDNLWDYRPRTYLYNSPYTLGRSFSLGLSIDIL